jgi:hypothetical protein
LGLAHSEIGGSVMVAAMEPAVKGSGPGTADNETLRVVDQLEEVLGLGLLGQAVVDKSALGQAHELVTDF